MREQKIAPGVSIVSFDNQEDFASYLEQQHELEQRMMEQVVPEQLQITWGDHAIKMIDGIVIFGHILTEEEFLEDEGFDEATGQDEEEIIYLLDQLRKNHDRGRRYGIWFSAQFPQGEYGSHSVAELWKISSEDFQQARENQWVITSEQADRYYNEIAQATGRSKEEQQ